MPYVTTQDVVIDALAPAAAIDLAKLFWSVMASDAGVLAHPRYVPNSAGVPAHFEFYFSENPITPARSFATYDDMLDDLTPADGAVVFCYDPDSDLRGTYAKSGASGSGTYTRTVPTIEDKCWVDYNHPQRLLELAIVAWASIRAGLTPVPAYLGNPGWVGPTTGDWRNARMTLDMEARQTRLGANAKMLLHCQSRVASLSTALTALYPSAPNPKYLLPNYGFVRQLISDALTFAQQSWGLPNGVPVVRSSGRKQIEIIMSDQDVDVVCYGDSGRDPEGRLVNYGDAPIAEALVDFAGNIMVQAYHPNPVDGEAFFDVSSASTIPSYDRLRGTLRLYGWKIEALT